MQNKINYYMPSTWTLGKILNYLPKSNWAMSKIYVKGEGKRSANGEKSAKAKHLYVQLQIQLLFDIKSCYNCYSIIRLGLNISTSAVDVFCMI